ncbi:methyl-accepting chemotaxis protein [Catalinimonas alkaloidigena]|uniref:Methyl-accepting chemotaxis protein n=1 Tax=Catalinimonas alkaloidigena TaxID=1075417 RepID=A0A1G9J1P9_9BACT|nr:GAF domain-containing protein [Catalinimonas alkaloidigena]SDL31206.1 methyl-accepting chemotaxis protein [Catalinimonas alkaloidigena]
MKNPSTQPSLSPALREAVTQEKYKQAEYIIRYVVLGMFGFGVFLALFYDTWVVGMGVGTCATLAYVLTYMTARTSALHRYVTSTVLGVLAVQYIYQMHGLFEMHFTLFVVVTVMILYEDWRVLVPVTLVVVVHHTTFAYLQNVGYSQVYFSQLDYVGLQTLVFHYGLFVVQVVLCGFWAHRNHQYSLTQRVLREEQRRLQEKNVQFANAIASGELEVAYELDEEDTLGKALISMRDGLQQAARATERRNWATMGHSRLNEVLRQNNQSVDQLADQVLHELVSYLKLNQGAIFLLNDDDAAPRLIMRGCYAYNRKKYMQMEIAPGEGLVGQVYLEGDLTYMTEIPSNYVRITSGLGEATPTSLILVPLCLNGQTVGVMELASFREYQPHELDFLKKSAESIASTVISVRTNEQTSRLLEQSRQLTERMQAQEEELLQNLEEMQATQEEMMRQRQEQEQMA